MTAATPANSADREKQGVAASSVAAAVGLTTIKLVVGLSTGSLGILAEAAHSGLDMVAAIVTLFAVRISGRPADRSHLYGHGKVENLSALFETFLLLVTCGWIIMEAVHRLMAHNTGLEVTVWSFAVMVTSIVVDISRSRMLYRAAKKHNSQALEADALHFSTDIWSSSVVLVGLASVHVSQRLPEFAWLRFADSIAAILVAVICLYVIFQLGARSIHVLLDAAPPGMEERIRRAAESVPGVSDCHNIRIRTAGPQVFIDVHVLVDGSQSLEKAHELTDVVERAIQAELPGSDVTVHPEPDETVEGRA